MRCWRGCASEKEWPDLTIKKTALRHKTWRRVRTSTSRPNAGRSAGQKDRRRPGRRIAPNTASIRSASSGDSAALPVSKSRSVRTGTPRRCAASLIDNPAGQGRGGGSVARGAPALPFSPGVRLQRQRRLPLVRLAPDVRMPVEQVHRARRRRIVGRVFVGRHRRPRRHPWRLSARPGLALS